MKRVLAAVLMVGIGGFFLLAGVLKVADPVEFARSILRYQLVGPGLSWIAAVWLPWLEILAALALAFKAWRGAGLTLLFGLLVVFQAGLASAIARGLDIECGCLGSAAAASASMALLRNCFLMAGIGLLFFLERRRA